MYVIVGMEFEAVKALIDFMYTGNLQCNSKNVLTLMAAANKLAMPSAVELCKEFMTMLSTMPTNQVEVSEVIVSIFR